MLEVTDNKESEPEMLKIPTRHGEDWTAAEEDTLRTNAGLTARQIAALLGRTPAAVKWRRQGLANGSLSANHRREVGQLLAATEPKCGEATTATGRCLGCFEVHA